MGASGEASRFSFTAAGATRPVWSRDVSHILFTSVSTGQLSLFRRSVNGTEKEQNLGTIPFRAEVVPLAGSSYGSDWSSDARTALLTVTQPTTGRDIAAYSIDTRRLTPVFDTAAYEIQPRFSPDDRWIAYASNETGRWEIFVEPFPPSGSRKQVSTSGGSQPVWRRDGRELYFVAPDRKLMAVSVTPGATFAHGSPRALFETRMRPTYPPYPVNYDVTSDGQRFLIDSVRPNTGPTISIVVNWKAAARGERK